MATIKNVFADPALLVSRTAEAFSARYRSKKWADPNPTNTAAIETTAAQIVRSTCFKRIGLSLHTRSRRPWPESKKSRISPAARGHSVEYWRETGSTTCLQPSILEDSGSGFSPYRQVGHLMIPQTWSRGLVASVVVPRRAVELAAT